MAHRHREILLAAVVGASMLAGCTRPRPTAIVQKAAKPAPLKRVAPVEAPTPPPMVPRVGQAVAIDGSLAEVLWRRALHSGGFVDEATGLLGVPHSELRIADDGTHILLGLYAADEDIVAHAVAGGPIDPQDDAFDVQIQKIGATTTYLLHVAANTAVKSTVLDLSVAPPKEATTVAACAIEMDGTINDGKDDDEEWVAECLIPMAPLALRVGDTVKVTAKRCDTPKNADRRCGEWRARVQLQ